MKPPFKPSIVLLTLSFSVVAFDSTTAAEAKPPLPDLIGTVRSKDGPPLKDAGVFIYTAGPRVGTGFL